MKLFTFEYVQPSEYHFSLDSIETSQLIADWVRSKGHSPKRILDLCAGTGVMGLELACHLSSHSVTIDFVEIQALLRSYFDKNAQEVRNRDLSLSADRQLELQWLQMNYENLRQPEFADRYDLILANPPYFRVGQGKQPDSDFKNRSRFFIDSTVENLIDAVIHVLKPGGFAFVLVRPLDDHGYDSVQEWRQRLRYQARVRIWANVRGTHLLRLQKI